MSHLTRSSSTVIPTGATLGMLGGGQLGMMFIEAAHAAGYRVHVYCPEEPSPASTLADEYTAKPYDDLGAVAEFAKSVAAVSYEFENVPGPTAEACAAQAPVRPGANVLRVCQERRREKTFLTEHGIPVGGFRPVETLGDLRDGVQALGLPSVLKTAGGGYDGKGQRVLHAADDAERAWADLGRVPCVLEAWVPFERELSVIVARGVDGTTRTTPPILNTHRHHILDVSMCPPPGDTIASSTAESARDVAMRTAQAIGLVGVLAVEMFQLADGAVLVNELAPRPHNSGHLTIEAFTQSQFDWQVQCMTGQPPQPAELRQPAAMVNLLGDLWQPGLQGSPDGSGRPAEPDWSAMQSQTNSGLHLYGKAHARPGRKMGHYTLLASSSDAAAQTALKLRQALNTP